MVFIYGDGYPELSGEKMLTLLTDSLATTLSQPLPIEILFQCAEIFVNRLNDNAFLAKLDEVTRAEIQQFCKPAQLQLKLEHELGVDPFSLRRFDLSQSHFESFRPLGVVLHTTPANATSLPFLALLESLLVGNINWLRPSTSDAGLTGELIQAFLECDNTKRLANYIAILPVATDTLSSLLPYVDGVSAWGGDAALTAIRQQLPSGCRWIPWGHKISFAWLIPKAWEENKLKALATEICRFDQQACSSPQVVFVDTESYATLLAVGQRLAEAMQQCCGIWPFQQPDDKAAADITSAEAFIKLANTFAGEQNHSWHGENWRILLQNKIELEPSPLYRTVLLRPLPRSKLIQTLRPWRSYLQTCGLSASQEEIAQLSQLLLAAGVNRVTTLAGFHSGYTGEPHDGVMALQRLVRRVSVSLNEQQLETIATLDMPPSQPASVANQPIMSRATFIEKALQPSAELFFRSGGSSGVPKIAGFTYRDYHRQMQAAADGMLAAGLDPSQDKVLNLMYAGNLYGGLLSFFTVLDKARVKHLPMGGPHDDDYAEIAKTIVGQQVNTLIGMPSTLFQLFTQQESILRNYSGIKKILTGGEHVGQAQRDFFQSFAISSIRSALYGSVDAGPLGHSCCESEDGVFHLMTDIQWLEIVALDCDKPVPAGEIGRLLFTSRARQGHNVIRYDIGDLGSWVEGPCACGAPSPRFKLHGRHGNLLRIGTVFLPAQELATLGEVPVQFILDNNPISGLERLHVLAAGDELAVHQRLSHHPELKVALEAGFMEIMVTWCPVKDFERHPQSGKTPLAIDKRG